MPEWKKEIKYLADDFGISQVRINRMLKKVERECMNRVMPSFYKGNQNDYLYDNAQREMMKLICA